MTDRIETAAPRGLPAPFYGIACLPGGLVGGFISVTLGFGLGHRGVSLAAISGLVGLYLLPTTWSFLMGPIVDVSLTPRRWYAIMVTLTAVCFVGFGLTPMTARALPMLGLLCFCASAAVVSAGAALTAAMALTTPPDLRGPIAGWVQVAASAGGALGGGLGLWLDAHVGGPGTAAFAMAALCLICTLPVLWMRLPSGPLAASLAERVRGMGDEIWTLARSRMGFLAIVVMVIPSALGASAHLLPAAAGAWRASSDLVALVRGALGAVTVIPGCLLGGYLCRHIRHRTVYICAALAYAAGLTAMATAPHTPLAFAAFLILNSAILGVALAALNAVNFDTLGAACPATVSAALSSLCNAPLLLATVLLGQAAARLGINGMLLTEAGLGAAAVAGYAALVWFWREGATPARLPITIGA